MTKIILFLFVTFLSMPCIAQQNTVIYDEIYKEGMFYFSNSKPYTGDVVIKFKNGKVCEEGYSEGGYKTGKWKFHYGNGNIFYEGEFTIKTEYLQPIRGSAQVKPSPGGYRKVSLRSGKWTYYYRNGSKEREITYKLKNSTSGRGFRWTSKEKGKWTYWNKKGDEINEATWREYKSKHR